MLAVLGKCRRIQRETCYAQKRVPHINGLELAGPPSIHVRLNRGRLRQHAGEEVSADCTRSMGYATRTIDRTTSRYPIPDTGKPGRRAVRASVRVLQRGPASSPLRDIARRRAVMPVLD